MVMKIEYETNSVDYSKAGRDVAGGETQHVLNFQLLTPGVCLVSYRKVNVHVAVLLLSGRYSYYVN